MAVWPVVALVGLVWVVAPTPALAALPTAPDADLERIEAYLNDLSTLRSDFVQINPDGGRVTGQLYYERPDKMRLDYDPPSDILIISDGLQLIYYDRKLEQVSHLFIGSTPLGFLLSDDIRLSGDVTVTRLASAFQTGSCRATERPSPRPLAQTRTPSSRPRPFKRPSSHRRRT
jgi:outer membrane lipoprotein-sorting protein